jgi:hypothetical protein
MDKNTLLLGKILGEIYRLHDKIYPQDDPNAITQLTYGLLNGFESDIRLELEAIGFISEKKENVILTILEKVLTCMGI